MAGIGLLQWIAIWALCCCMLCAGENASELQRCSRYVVKLASRLDNTIQAVHTIYIDRKRRAVDRLLTAYVQVRAQQQQQQQRHSLSSQLYRTYHHFLRPSHAFRGCVLP